MQEELNALIRTDDTWLITTLPPARFPFPANGFTKIKFSANATVRDTKPV